jgi:hypothetical protein
VSADQLELAQALLRPLLAATAVSFLIALLILRSVFRRDALAKVARVSLLIALLAFVVPAIAAFIAAATWPTESSSSYDLEESLGRQFPLVVAVSFAVALSLLWWRFRQEDRAKLVFASVLVAQFACTIPFLDMVFYQMELEKWSLSLFLSVFTWRLWLHPAFAPWLLSLVVWLIAFVRHSRPGEKSYTLEAVIALVLVVGVTFWFAHQTGAIG